MKRQRIFMDAAVPMIREKIDESSGFVTTMLDTLAPYLTTNMVRGRMINEINRAYHYKVEPVQYLDGDHVIGEDGFMEFHADEQSIVDFVLNAFYTKRVGFYEEICFGACEHAARAQRRWCGGGCSQQNDDRCDSGKGS